MAKAEENKAKTDYYIGQIKTMLTKVTNKVDRGSYDTEVAFKKCAADAQKAVNASRPTLARLISAYNQLATYY